MSETILFEQFDHVLQIRINRISKRNALTLDMYQKLYERLSAADSDPDIYAVLVCGTDKYFTAGNDLGDFLDSSAWNKQNPAYRLVQLLPLFTKPLIAAVNGPAIGIGTTLLLHCDLVIADEDAVFQTPFVNLGLIPEAASTCLLPRLLGHQKAAELLFLGEKFSAKTALSLRLINTICPPGKSLRIARSLAEKIAAQPWHAVQETKRLMKQSVNEELSGHIERETDAFIRCLNDPQTLRDLRNLMNREQ